MSWVIEAHCGVGPVKFGMSREEVEKAIGKPPSERLKLSKRHASEADFFDGYTVHYDSNNRCAAIEFDPRLSFPLKYDGYNLFAHPARHVREWARSRDPKLDADYGFLSKDMGLAMSAPSIDVPESDLDEQERIAPAESIFVFRPGYYEEESARLKALDQHE